MYRITILSGIAYAVKIESLEEKEIDEIMSFIESSEPVILCNDLEDFTLIFDYDIKMVEREDED